MATGDLNVQITTLTGKPVNARVEIDLKPISTGGGSTGGQKMTVDVNMGTSLEVDVTGIECRGGPGTTYRLLANTPHYRPYGFFQLIQEGKLNEPSDDIEFWVKPGDITGIRGPKFADLDDLAQSLLKNAAMTRSNTQDADLLGLTGTSLYNRLGPLRQAGLLNIVKKASHSTADECLSSFLGLLVSRQDRIFAIVEPQLATKLNNSPRFRGVSPALHTPLPGFQLTGQSFKSKDAHANLQVTFMIRDSDGAMAADIDVDESSGIKHGFEVIRNAVIGGKTNPYLIHEFMTAADPIKRTLDPGYEFVF